MAKKLRKSGEELRRKIEKKASKRCRNNKEKSGKNYKKDK